MVLKVRNDWKDHGWWIMAEEAEMPVLWITSHAVVEGRHWFTRRAVQIVGELICFNIWYHILSYRCTYIYI
jgi:hypothetical protein